ncbi:hypothetical protein BH09MYX1_BH09MYX1_29890 [soil metagenome]
MPEVEARARAKAARILPLPRLRLRVRGSLTTYLSPLALAWAWSVLAALPARLALSADQGNGSAIRWAYFSGGLLSDLATMFPWVMLGCVAATIVVRRTPSARWPLACAMSLLFVLLLLVHNGAIVFRLERGHLPDAHDVATGLGHSDFARAEIPTLFAGPFLLGNVIVLALATIAARWSLIVARRTPSPTPLVLFLCSAVTFAILRVASGKLHAFTASLHNDDAMTSPVSHIAASLLRGDGNARGIREVVLATKGTPDDVARGAALYGFSPDAAARVTAADASGGAPAGACSLHPLRVPLDERTTPWTDAGTALSAALFEGRDLAPVVFHVSLESVRADDVATLHPSAPRVIAPFLSHAFESDADVLAFPHAFQSDVRTTQALAAVMCGVGAAPLHLAFGRDLGNVPLRCASDVLHDAGFSLDAIYGHEFVFDDMFTFLRFHGFAMEERRNLPKDAPRGVWDGVSDAPVYAAALHDAIARGGAQYDFVLTLSNHTPFTPPADVDPVAAREIHALCKARDLTGENCDRLVTLRYADDSLRGFLDAIAASPIADRAIVLVMADHTTHVREPWESEEARADASAQIPGFLWLSPGLRASVSDPATLRDAETRFNELAATSAFSNSDVPRFLLSLLSKTRAVRDLPAAARWHTLAGQTTSRDFRGLVPGEVGWGIDAHAELFAIEGDLHAHRKPVTVDPSQRGAEIDPSLQPALAFWGAFLRSQDDCASTPNLAARR